MDFITCHEHEAEGWVVDLGKGYSGFSSIESLVSEFYCQERFSIIEAIGFWYPSYDIDQPTKKCDRWKLHRHEVYQSQSGKYDAVIVLYYEPVNIQPVLNQTLQESVCA